MKIDLNEMMRINTYVQARDYLEKEFATTKSSFFKNVKVYEIYTHVGTEKEPYGYDHGVYDSTMVDVYISDWVKVSKERYEAFTPDYIADESSYKRCTTERVYYSLLDIYNEPEGTTKKSLHRKKTAMKTMSAIALGYSMKLFEMSNEIPSLEHQEQLFDELHCYYLIVFSRLRKMEEQL